MDTNYRNAREIFDYAAEIVRREVPDADIPQAVRETGVHPVEGSLGGDPVAAVSAAVEELLGQVDGSVATGSLPSEPSTGWIPVSRTACGMSASGTSRRTISAA